MSIADNHRVQVEASPQGLTWEEVTGVRPRLGSWRLPEAVACWAADQGYTVLVMMPVNDALRMIEEARNNPVPGKWVPSEKQPLEKWTELEFRSADEIRASGEFRKRCGVAILTEKSGLVVIDLDSESGEAWLRKLARGREFQARILGTHKGRHLIFLDGGVAYKNQARQVAPGVDIRGRGGIELIYDPTQPGRHPLDLTEPGELPSWLAEHIPLADEPYNGNGNGNHPPLNELARDGIPPGQHDDIMLRLAMKRAASGEWTREEWLADAYGILNRSGEGVDENGNSRERFSNERILGWWDSAVKKLEREAKEKVNGSYPWNDVGNALRLRDMSGDDMIYVPEIKTWLAWDGRVWANNPAMANARAVAVSDALRKLARKVKDEDEARRLLRFATASGNDGRITAMLRQAAALDGMTLSAGRFDTSPNLLTVRNGTLVLGEEVEFRAHSREDYCRTYATTDYDPDAESELWDTFLDMFVPDKEVRDYLQRLAGYTLLGANQDRRLIFLIGPGSTGKTTFLKLIHVTLGEGNAGPFNLSLFRDRGQDAPRPDLLRAFGRRFIYATEPNAEWRLHADTIKRITGGDTLAARAMYSDKFVERTASFTPWIAGNAYPRIEHADPALWRRLAAIPFREVVSKAADNPNFTINFPPDERPAVLRWLVDGYIKYAKNGLDNAPKPVQEAIEQLRVSLSAIDRWIDGRCEIGPAFKCPATDLFENYRGWCDDEVIPERERLTQTAFGEALNDRGYAHPGYPERVGPRSEGRKVRMRHGLRIRHEN